jgi:hypothetical protein
MLIIYLTNNKLYKMIIKKKLYKRSINEVTEKTAKKWNKNLNK